MYIPDATQLLLLHFLSGLLALLIGRLIRNYKEPQYGEVILKRWYSIFLNNILAYLPCVVPIVGSAVLLLQMLRIGRSSQQSAVQVFLKIHVYLELLAASCLATLGILALALPSLDMCIYLLLLTIVLLLVGSLIESKVIR
ncbi:hypothetical protein DRN52_06260 [Thermococci archaeon]|nr:MAG: hypothetical protein DRN52_06260 [Thermococci archaeon]